MSHIINPSVSRRQALLALGLASTLAGCNRAAPAEAQAASPVKVEFVKHEILMLVYPKFTALDLIGPQHVFSLLGPEFKTRLVWKNTEEIRSDTGIPIRPTLSFRDCPDKPTLLFIPGGTDGTLEALEDRQVREFVARLGASATYVTSVCTGSLILGAAGLLRGYQATTHWLALESLAKFGAEPVAKRVVEDRNRITGAGVTAGIDFALTLAAKLQDEPYAKTVQLMMEYDPQPPFESGNPTVADPKSVNMLKAMCAPFHSNLDAAIARIEKQG
jgi:cyclohexyl-isocyanide hydratase